MGNDNADPLNNCIAVNLEANQSRELVKFTIHRFEKNVKCGVWVQT
jgi:hypothetical protein